MFCPKWPEKLIMQRYQTFALLSTAFIPDLIACRDGRRMSLSDVVIVFEPSATKTISNRIIINQYLQELTFATIL